MIGPIWKPDGAVDAGAAVPVAVDTGVTATMGVEERDTVASIVCPSETVKRESWDCIESVDNEPEI